MLLRVGGGASTEGVRVCVVVLLVVLLLQVVLLVASILAKVILNMRSFDF